MKLIDSLAICESDEVVEFAPGLGFTASIALSRNPKSYTGIELNEEAAALLRKTIEGRDRRIVVANAADPVLEAESRDKVYGEAMLTMLADHRKAEIIREAYRILKPGGKYAIHELGLMPEELPEDKKAEIQRDLAKAIRVNARPLTIAEWTALLEKEGFRIIKVETCGMCLLEFRRMVDDEGLLRTLKILGNILIHGAARKRIMEMHSTFRKHRKSMNAVAIVAEKVGN